MMHNKRVSKTCKGTRKSYTSKCITPANTENDKPVKKAPVQYVLEGKPIPSEDLRMLKGFMWLTIIGGVGRILCNPEIIANILSSVLAFFFVLGIVFRKR